MLNKILLNLLKVNPIKGRKLQVNELKYYNLICVVLIYGEPVHLKKTHETPNDICKYNPKKQ